MAFPEKVLKDGHTMLGKSLLSVMKKLEEWDPEDKTQELYRLEKSYPLEEYSELELCREFEKLTGKSTTNVFSIVQTEENKISLRQLVHLTIEQANLLGMPQCQTLQVRKDQDKEKEETAVVFIGAQRKDRECRQDYRQVICQAEAPDLDLDIQYGKTNEPMDSLSHASGGDSELDEPMDSPGHASCGDSESPDDSLTELLIIPKWYSMYTEEIEEQPYDSEKEEQESDYTIVCEKSDDEEY